MKTVNKENIMGVGVRICCMEVLYDLENVLDSER